MDNEAKELRKHERFSAKGTFQVYTSRSNIAYLVSVKDISQSGAFIRTKHLPHPAEKINYHILNEDGIKQYSGHGRVVWVHGSGAKERLGFAIEFDRELRPEEQNMLMGGNEEELDQTG